MHINVTFTVTEYLNKTLSFSYSQSALTVTAWSSCSAHAVQTCVSVNWAQTNSCQSQYNHCTNIKINFDPTPLIQRWLWITIKGLSRWLTAAQRHLIIKYFYSPGSINIFYNFNKNKLILKILCPLALHLMTAYIMILYIVIPFYQTDGEG